MKPGSPKGASRIGKLGSLEPRAIHHHDARAGPGQGSPDVPETSTLDFGTLAEMREWAAFHRMAVGTPKGGTNLYCPTHGDGSSLLPYELAALGNNPVEDNKWMGVIRRAGHGSDAGSPPAEPDTVPRFRSQ